MQGDLSEGTKALAEIRASIKPDLILAIGVLALQAIAQEQPEIPVVFSMVLNPLGVLGESRKNVTGASMNVSPKLIFDVIEKLRPQVQRVGVIHNPARTGHLVRLAMAAARDRGLQLVVREIGSPREAIPALDLLREDHIDLLWILPDETILAPEVIEQMLLASYTSKIPVIGLSQDQAQQGAVLSLQFGSSEDIGKQAAELANRVLEGEPVSEVGYTTVRQINVTVNLKAAQKIGFTVPESILAIANTLIQ
jgi:putative ABC transport system substrate-binding protein